MKITPDVISSLAVERTLLGAKGIATRNKDATRGSWLTSSNKKLLVAKGIAGCEGVWQRFWSPDKSILVK